MKQQAKDLLRQHSTTKITAAYLLSTVGLSMIIHLFITPQLLNHFLSGTSDLLSTQNTILLFLMIISTVFGWVMNYGYRQWALRFSLGEQAPLSSLIEGFAHNLHIILLTIYKMLFSYLGVLALLWGVLLFLIPVLLFAGGIGGEILILLSVGVAVFVGLFVLYLRFSFSSFVLIEQKEKSAFKALKDSAALTKIHFKQLSKLHFSFWNWGLFYLASTLFYYGLNYALNAITMTGDFSDLWFASNSVAFYVSTAVDCFLLFKFYPLYYVTLALFYQDLRKQSHTHSDENLLKNNLW